MAVEFPALPYDLDALAPHVSARTLEFHYGKHHKSYVDKLNAAISGTGYENHALEQIIAAAHESGDGGVFNNAAQTWNHTFLWHSMAPNGGGEPKGDLLKAIRDQFGDMDAFRAGFKDAAMTQFGSGWAWLVKDDKGLAIAKTGNAETPLTEGVTPLMTLDVWEHAYYLDYQNKRDAYIDTFLDKLVNWEFAAKNFSAA